MKGIRLTSFGWQGDGSRSSFLLESSDAAIFLDLGRNLCGRSDSNPHISAFKALGSPPVLVSHAHADHAGDIATLSAGTDVFGDRRTAMLLGDRVSHVRWRDPADLPGVTAYPVDHSVPGALAFIIELGGQRIAYTGDLRFHGINRLASEAFVDALAAKRIHVLICEGTDVSLLEDETKVATYRSEADVLFGLNAAMLSPIDWLFVQCAALHIERLESTWAAAQLSGRRLIIERRHAGALLALAAEDKRYRPIILNTLLFSAFSDELTAGWALNGGKIIEASLVAWLRAHHGRYAICLPNPGATLEAMCDEELRSTVGFIRSTGEPGPLTQSNGVQRVDTALRKLNAKLNATIHVSGHASAQDIGLLIQAANPDTLVPVHTRHPEMFRHWHDRVWPAGPLPMAL